MSQPDPPATKAPAEKELRSRLRQAHKELAALKRSEALWTSSFRFSPAALCIVTLGDDTVRDVNKRFSEITGYPRESLIGQPVARLFASDAANPFAQADALAADSAASMPAAFVAYDGEAHSAIWQIQVAEVNKELCALATLTDLTDGHQRELALNRSAAELQHRISELESQNDVMRTHEERTLARIDAMVQETQQLKLDLVQSRRLFEELRAETQRMRERISNSLPPAANTVRGQPGSAEKAFQRLTRMLRGKVAEPGVGVTPDDVAAPLAALPTFAADEPPAAPGAPEPDVVAEPAPAPVQVIAAHAAPAEPEPPAVAAPDRTTPVIRLPVSVEHLSAHIAALRQMADRIDAELGIA